MSWIITDVAMNRPNSIRKGVFARERSRSRYQRLAAFPELHSSRAVCITICSTLSDRMVAANWALITRTTSPALVVSRWALLDSFCNSPLVGITL